MSFHITKNISYNDKNGTNSHASIHSLYLLIQLIGFIYVFTLSTYPSHLSHPPVYLSTDLNHVSHLSLSFLLDIWPMYYIFLLVDCNAGSVLTIVKLSFILDTYLRYYGSLSMYVSF